MALLIKSVINYSRLTTQVKHILAPQFKAAFSAPPCSSRSIAIKMNKDEIVPDVIPVAPSELLEVEFPSGAVALAGNELTPTEVKDAPDVKWKAYDKHFYTLCMTDPDAPSRLQCTAREWHHWLVVNIPGMNVSKGEVLSEYIGSGPPPGSGLHRYVFLVYKQPSKINFVEPRLNNSSPANREKFSIRNFAEKYYMGNPIAGNYYYAAYDDYVPILYKKLGSA